MMIGGVLLAAGTSRRFGSQKLVQPLAGGIPMAVLTARKLKRGVDAAVAVVRPDTADLGLLLGAEGLQVTTCEDADKGMGVSFAAGVAALRHMQGWVVALADMPCIHPDTIRQIVATLRQGASLVAPVYRGRRGHPVGFGQRYRRQLLALRGDVGARALLEREKAQIWMIETDDPGVLTDIDTPEDLVALLGASLG